MKEKGKDKKMPFKTSVLIQERECFSYSRRMSNAVVEVDRLKDKYKKPLLNIKRLWFY